MTYRLRTSRDDGAGAGAISLSTGQAACVLTATKPC